MKRILLSLLLISLVELRQAFATPISSTNNGIYIVVASVGQAVYPLLTNEPFAYDSSLIWEPFSNVGFVRMVYGNFNYAFRIRMFGPDGKETPKTALGEQYGSRFDQFGSDPEEISSQGAAEIDAQVRYDLRDDSFPGRFFPSPKELFRMDQAGMYTMELEIQLNGPHQDNSQPGLGLIRFPPMKIKVEKPVIAPFFAFSKTNQGVYFSIVGTKTNGLAAFDDALQWRVYCEHQNSMLYSPGLSCGFKMNLLGPDGKDVSKTSLGKTIGVSFDSVETRDKLPPDTVVSDLDFRSGFSDIVPPKPLPRIQNCFAMDKAGIYTLELQVQLFRVNYKTPGEPGPEELLRFPPMTIKVNRP